jgi:hypothetical protein
MGVHDDIWVRSISLNDGHSLLSIVTADLWGMPREDMDDIVGQLKLGKGEHLLLCSTGVHSAPDMLGIFGPDSRTTGTDEEYVHRLRSAVVECVKASRSSMKEVSVKVSSGRPNVRIGSSRTPGLVDETCINIYLEEKGGGKVHSIVNSTCPPVLSGEENTSISSDWLGSFYERTEERLKGIPLFLQASPGGVLPPIVSSRKFDEAEKVGKAMSEQAVSGYGKAVEIDANPIMVDQRIVEVPVENRLMMALSAMGTLRCRIRDSRRTAVAAVRLGALSMATFPGSVFPEISLEVKRMMKSPHRMVASLANDFIGFIIPPSKFDPAMYEERMSLGRDVAPVLISEIAHRL